MLKAFSTHIIQHLMAQNGWANVMLQPFATKSVALNIGFISTSLVILENGELAIAPAQQIADASITIPASLALRLMAKDEAAKLQVAITGDTHLASEFAKVLTNIQWDYEDDLSKIIGEMAAYSIGSYVRNTTKSVQDTSIRLAEMLSEYWQEQMPLIAKKHDVQAFNNDVDALRADLARLEKKLAKLTLSMQAAHGQNPNLEGTAINSKD